MKTKIIHAALFTPAAKGRWGLPILLWGEPGVGKSAIIEGVCAETGLPCVVLSPAEQGEGVFGVVPVPSKDGSVLTFPRPEWTDQVKDGGVVFVDEMSSTPPALQAPLQGLLLAARIGGHQLGPRVRRIGAANPVEIATAGFELSPPNANRLGHYDWGAPSVAQHAEYMLSADTATGETKKLKTERAAAEEARVAAAWPAAWARAVGLETGFLQRRPATKNQCPKAGDSKIGCAWPSDRSWEAATRALAAAPIHGLSAADTEEFVAGFIGAGVAGELFQFIQESDLPDPVAVLDKRVTFKHSSKRLDRTAAVLSGCQALVLPRQAERRDARANALWELISDITDDKSSLDVCGVVAAALLKNGLHGPKVSSKAMLNLNSFLKAVKFDQNSQVGL